MALNALSCCARVPEWLASAGDRQMEILKRKMADRAKANLFIATAPVRH
jgi:hypothetical protein